MRNSFLGTIVAIALFATAIIGFRQGFLSTNETELIIAIGIAIFGIFAHKFGSTNP